MQQVIPKKSNNAFDFLRLIAALSVVINHTTFYFESSFELWFGDGVVMFFILSGLLVFKSCENAFDKSLSVLQFYTNRFLRIAPAIYAYLIVTLISFFILGVINISSIDSGFIAWVASTLFLVPVYPASAFQHFGVGVVNGSLWTIPVEINFYVILPLFVLLQRKHGFVKMIVPMFVISIISIVFNNFMLREFLNCEPLWLKLFGISVLPYLLYFCIGILLGKTWNKIHHSPLLAGLCLIMYIIIRSEGITNKGFLYLFGNLLWALPFGYFLIWCGYNAPSVLNRITTKIGDISYGVYIWHMVVVNYFLYFNIVGIINRDVGVLLVILITVGLGLLSWRFIEKPALKYKPYSTRV